MLTKEQVQAALKATKNNQEAAEYLKVGNGLWKGIKQNTD